MTKRSDAQIKAEKAYDAKRKKVPVGCRLRPEDLERLDAVRGDESRAAVVERLLLEWIAERERQG